MKKLTFIFLAITVLSSISLAAPKAFKTVEEAVQKLAKHEPSHLIGERARFKAGQPMNIDKMYADLAAAAKLVKTTPITEDLAFQMERVALITIINNPAADGVAIILPAFIKYPKVFESAAEGLSEYDEALILDTLRGQQKSLDSQD